jgi:hypothetical protein
MNPFVRESRPNMANGVTHRSAGRHAASKSKPALQHSIASSWQLTDLNDEALLRSGAMLSIPAVSPLPNSDEFLRPRVIRECATAGQLAVFSDFQMVRFPFDRRNSVSTAAPTRKYR